MIAARASAFGLVASALARAVAEACVARGLDPAACDLPPQAELAGDAPVPAATLCQALDRGVALTGDPLFGFRAGLAIKVESFGLAAFAMRACTTLRHAADHFVRYAPLFVQSASLTMEERGGRATFSWHDPRRNHAAQFDELAMTALVACARQLLGSPERCERVDFVHRPSTGAAELERFFGGALAFRRSTTRLVVSSRVLDLPLDRADPALLATLDPIVSRAVAALGPATPVAHAVERALTRVSEDRLPTLAVIARALAMSPRQLHRALAGEQTSYRAVRRSALSRRAEQLLAEPGRTITEIAQLLGYSDQTAFSRAFRALTGRSPQQFRAEARRPPAR